MSFIFVFGQRYTLHKYKITKVSGSIVVLDHANLTECVMHICTWTEIHKYKIMKVSGSIVVLDHTNLANFPAESLISCLWTQILKYKVVLDQTNRTT